MKKTFWLLDVNYEVKNHSPEVWIWGIDEEEKRVLIIDRSFLAYFYLLIKEKENPKAFFQRAVLQQIFSETALKEKKGRAVLAFKMLLGTLSVCRTCPRV